MKKTILGVVLTLCVGTVLGQQDEKWRNGEVLVQLQKDTDIDLFINQNKAIELTNPELISKHINIWKFKFNPSITYADKAIESLYDNNAVITAQKNHIIHSRAVPNDPEFDEQWQYVQANDKDIDADLAWDVTTGGTTANNDEIVVCIIDDGVQLTHPDLAPNLWTNTNEIAGNGIDDDGNGYIDDVRGWNTYNSNDDVTHTPGQGLGSPVAGIVGAKGNNGVGVTGVNWDVKLMIVKGGGDESDAIAAYSYVLENRKLYNSTNGQKGAFVVATNASWGVDGGMASQAPLWCAMYDTLGNHGVLNAGAGPNANTNVDTDGDLPTQCPSNYLISVTNTNDQDEKVVQAGYGANSMDLGAPGEDAYTIDDYNGGTYDFFGGTSGATPHVAGTIGLLYSVPCSNFANLAKTDPKMAAEKVKEFILNGVDPNTSLNGITSTGGRLNVNNSVQALVNNCSSLGTEENNLELTQLSVYPNPINGNDLNISVTGISNENAVIEVYSLTGEIIQTKTVMINEGSNKIKLNLPSIAKGIYHLKITSNNSSNTIRFVK